MTRTLHTPSYWSGIAASTIPFEDVADYSRWACMLLENGFEGDGICALAGMEHESNLFVLQEWHRKALADLGVAPPDAQEALFAHARGLMEEFLAGRFTHAELLQMLRDRYLDTWEPKLEPFHTLHCAWWDHEEADWGLSSRDEIPERVKRECESFIATHQAEQAGLCDGDKPTR